MEPTASAPTVPHQKSQQSLFFPLVLQSNLLCSLQRGSRKTRVKLAPVDGKFTL